MFGQVKISTLLALGALVLPALGFPQNAASGARNAMAPASPMASGSVLSTGNVNGNNALLGKVSITPHDKYSSSVGVLGCKINTNRVAYWPSTPDCNNVCVKLSHEGRSVYLLQIDSSGGAHDISYDAWNFLKTGHSVKEPGQAVAGGGFEVDFEYVSANECKSLITDGTGKLPIAAANGLNWLTSCLGGSWVGNNYQLYNIQDPICHYGYDEKCSLAVGSNQPTCPHQLGANPKLDNPSDHKVVNLLYPTGQEEVAP